jgi:hypothetical protein
LTALDVAAGFEKTFSVGGIKILEEDAPPPTPAASATPAKTKPRTIRRTSVTHLQRETAAAAELIALCQSITADGKLDEHEVYELRTWLADHKVDLPARNHLFHTVERIVRDRVVTPEERDTLYRAIETAMPVDVRATIRAARLTRGPTLDAEVRRSRAERKRNEPVAYIDFFATGVSEPECMEAIRERTSEGDRVFLHEEESVDGVPVVTIRLIDGSKIGSVPSGDADAILRGYESGEVLKAAVKNVLTGGRYPAPIIYVNFYRADADVDPELRDQPTVKRLGAASRSAGRSTPRASHAGPHASDQAVRVVQPSRVGCVTAIC